MRRAILCFAAVLGVGFFVLAAWAQPKRPAAPEAAGESLIKLLDAPLLFVKQHPYMAAHIYDDYYTWHPGGGIYVIENPAAPPAQRRIRAVIDPKTPETLGVGVYRDPELSWDAKKIVFAFKGSRDGGTSIYEIGIDGRGLRRLTNPEKDCTKAMPVRAAGRGRHDITPCYLPDGRIVFTSTRTGARVPCFNSEVDTLHVMNADGSDIHPVSSNNVTEFDPAVLPDGRIVYGRWEYVDKTALYMQSLWTMFPDGTNETALFGNNLAKPTAILDPRPVPGTSLVAAALTPHNGQAVGAIVIIDPRRGKNALGAITNFTPEYRTQMDQGLKRGPSDPWPLSKDVILIANNNVKGYRHGVIQIIDRKRRELVHFEPDISCYSPMLVKPRKCPTIIADVTRADQPGRFLLQDVYRGLAGVRRGEVKRLRVIEETTRTSGIPGGGRWWNQAFLVSWQGAYVVKNILGTVPVQADGSAYFEAPPGRALYVQALDADGRLVQSMRTFVQAVPGVTRSCIGCHEDKYGAPQPKPFIAPMGPPARIRDESWGSGFLDYPTMIQPVLDKNCVSCHGGDKGISGGIDLTGGWTWAFNISFETLIKNTLVGFLNCHNSRISTTVLLPPRKHGSGAAPLAKLLVDGHKDRLKKMTRTERDLILAWMDTNCNYYGTWNWTEHATCNAVLQAGKALTGPMKQAGCTKCHAGAVGNDWVNLRTPERSRILRAPLAAGKGSLGLAWCRDRKARRVLPLVTQRQQPPDVFRPSRTPAPDKAGKAVVSFASTEDKHYQAMLAIIRKSRASALGRPRVDMPGADIRPGACRRIVPMDAPETAPALQAAAKDGRVALSWLRSSATIGLTFRLYRSPKAGFTPDKETFLVETTMFAHRDDSAPNGVQHYALVASFDDRVSGPARCSVTVRAPAPPAASQGLTASVQADTGEIVLTWRPAGAAVRYHVYRSAAGADKFTRLTTEPILAATWADSPAAKGRYDYRVTGVNQRGAEGPPSAIAAATAPGERTEPTFVAFAPGAKAKPKLHGAARAQQDALDLAKGGYATFKHVRAFDPGRKFSVECRVKFDRVAQMPVVLSCGQYQGAGWFIQAFTGRWRLHLAGVNCDGGKVAAGKWIHLVATFDGRRATLYQDGRKVASAACQATPAAWSGPLVVGQYSQVGPGYQVLGRIAGVQLYRRTLTARDAAAAFKTTQP